MKNRSKSGHPVTTLYRLKNRHKIDNMLGEARINWNLPLTIFCTFNRKKNVRLTICIKDLIYKTNKNRCKIMPA